MASDDVFSLREKLGGMSIVMVVSPASAGTVSLYEAGMFSAVSFCSLGSFSKPGNSLRTGSVTTTDPSRPSKRVTRLN